MLLTHGQDELFMRIFLMTSDFHLVRSIRHGWLLLGLMLAFSFNSMVGASELAFETSVDCKTNQSSVDCGSAYSAMLDDAGKLWIAYVKDQHVYVSHSTDEGASYSTPVKVNKVAEDAEHNGENRPKIIVTPSSDVLLSWTLKTSNRYTGEIRFARSNDGGKTFSEPRTINDDGLSVGHRFESMFLTKSGHLYLAWIDKRELHASTEAGQDYAGAAIYYTVSADYGRNFSPNYPVSSNSCECCRIAIAPRGDDSVAILWRQIYQEEIRDHAFAILDPLGNVSLSARASFDDWYINACPHHGPAMEIADSANEYHMTWFSNGKLNQGIYYARYNPETKSSEAIVQVDGMPGAGHPDIKSFAGKLYLVWKGFDGSATRLNLMVSEDNGESWSTTQRLNSTELASDYPLLVKSKGGLFLSWHSDEHGYTFSRLADREGS